MGMFLKACLSIEIRLDWSCGESISSVKANDGANKTSLEKQLFYLWHFKIKYLSADTHVRSILILLNVLWSAGRNLYVQYMLRTHSAVFQFFLIFDAWCLMLDAQCSMLDAYVTGQVLAWRVRRRGFPYSCSSQLASLCSLTAPPCSLLPPSSAFFVAPSRA